MVVRAKDFLEAPSERTISSVPSIASLLAGALLVGLVGGGPFKLPHWRIRGNAQFGLVIRALQRRLASQPSIRFRGSMEAAGVRLCERGAWFTRECQDTGRGCGVSAPWYGDLSRASHAELVSSGAFGGVHGDSSASCEIGLGDESVTKRDTGD